MKKILVTGGSGFLGSRIAYYYKEKKSREYEIIAPTHEEMDITDKKSVKQFCVEQKPDVVIHCAAISDTGYAQEYPKKSYLINVVGTENLAKVTGELGIRLIFMSSDQIYNGKTIVGKEYNFTLDACKELEDDCPINEYGKQKKEAEQRSFQANPDTVALRLTWMYDIARQGMKTNSNLVTNLIQAFQEGRTLSFARHEYRGITNVWEVIYHLEKVMTIPAGIYNYGSQNEVSTITVARKALEIFAKDGNIVEDEKRFENRPRNLTITGAKAEKHGICFNTTLEGLLKFAEEMKEEQKY